MQERVRSYFRGLYNKWMEFEKAQKIRIVAIAVVLVAVLGVSVYMVARPKMVVLSSGLDTLAVDEIQTALEDAGIKSNVIKNATAVEVRQKDAQAAKIALAVKNVPSGGVSFTYQDALTASGMGTTESVKIENFKKVKESELAESLRMFDGVAKANVQLVIPEPDSYFEKDKKPSSAGIQLVLTKPMDKATAAAIARYVSRSVDGLSIEDVEIIDDTGTTLYSGLDTLTGGSASSEYDMEVLRKAELEAKIRGLLAPLYDDVKPSVNVVLDWDKMQSKTINYTSPMGPDTATGLVERETTENRSVTNGSTGEEPGLGSNDQAVTDYQMQTDSTGSASEKNRQSNFLHNEQESVTDKSVGGIDVERSSFSVIVYKKRKYDEETMTRNNQLNNMTWEAFKEDVLAQPPTALEIDPSILATLQAGIGIQNATIVGFEVPVFYDREVTPVKVEQIVMFAILALLILFLAYGLIKNTQPDEVTEIEPELSVEDLLVSTQLEEQREAEAERLAELEFGRESEIKRQIEKFVNDKPEAVAQLLRNWLNDDWE